MYKEINFEIKNSPLSLRGLVEKLPMAKKLSLMIKISRDEWAFKKNRKNINHGK